MFVFVLCQTLSHPYVADFLVYCKITIHTNKEKCEDDNKLIGSVSQDVLCHGAGDEGFVATIWLPLQQRLCRRFCCQGQ